MSYHPDPVLFVTSWFPSPGEPYAGIFVGEHLACARQSRPAALVHLTPDETDGIEPIAGYADAVRVGTPGCVRAPAIRKAGRWARWSAAVYLLARRTGARVLHSHTLDSARVASRVARLLDIPHVGTEHWTGYVSGAATDRQLRAARASYARCACLLPVSEHLGRHLEGHGIRARDLRVIGNSFDEQLFHLDAATDRIPGQILCVGSLIERKRQRHLVTAVSKLVERGVDASLVLVGGGPDAAQLEDLASTLGVRDRLELTGPLDKPAVADRMRTASVLALASEDENLPCVIIEALACGTPIVATHVGGIPEMVDENNGALVAVDDVEGLTQALAGALDTSARRPDEAVARTAARFSRAAIARDLDDVYQSVLRQRG